MGSEARETDDRDLRLLVMTAALREQGWRRATIAISRGGTMTVDVEAGDGAKVLKPEWRAK